MFFSPTTRSKVLLENWTTTTLTGIVLAIVFGALLSLCMEAIKCYRITQKMIFCLFKPPCARMSILKRLLSSLTHIVDVLIGYLLMLIVMTFNIYIFITVIIGAGFGHFLFRPFFFNRVNNKLQRRQCVLNTLNFAPEDRCQDCGESDSVQDNVRKLEASGSIISIDKDETTMTGHPCDSEMHTTIKVTETQV